MIRVEASFDDGSIYDLRVMQLLESYDIPTTFYIPVNWAKNLEKKGIQALPAEMIDVINERWGIGSHGVDHLLLTRYPVDIQRREIFESKDYWNDRGIQVTKFCYPRGYYTQDIKNLVKEAGYRSARTVAVGELSLPKDVHQTGTTVHVGLDRKEYGSSWLTYATRMMEEAIRKDREGEDVVYHFWGHSEEIDRNGQWANFETFLNMIDENLL